MPERARLPADLEPFGSFTVGESESIAVGEWAESFTTPAVPGRWHAYAGGAHDAELLDADDDEATPILLVCVAESALSRLADLHSAADPVAEFSIEGARVVVGDGALAGLFTGATATNAFYDHLDGVHGPLESGAGVTMMLEGDGRGFVRVARVRGLAIVVEVEIR
jgi:hypothetical protein